MFSVPEGREGWGGKGRTREALEEGGWQERRGSRIGRLFGVTTSVAVRRPELREGGGG